MKKSIFAVMAVCFIASLAHAAPMKPMMMKGTIIDNMCAGGHKADMATFIKTHTKSCALMPACEKSGYSLYSDGKLMKFTDASNKKIADFLKMKSSKLNVDVEVNHAGDKLDLVSIKNAK
ncbi:MAG: hypothetical protein PHR22_04470 [Candidatus Omnitrophica bacterium]|nr:hypothetical protein [Candidatus Omnitrophota bacterium]